MNAPRLEPADTHDAPEQPLDFPVIETGVQVDDAGPDLEDYVATYGGLHLVDELRKVGPGEGRLSKGNVGNGEPTARTCCHAWMSQ